MASNAKQVAYYDVVSAPVFLDIIRQRADVELTRLLATASDAENAAVLARTHVYQMTSARDELPMPYRATEDLFRRHPDILCVSTNGAGYDTVDLDACTAAGVLAVNQAGGNKEGVAEHALGMMLVLSKRIIPADRVMRRQAGIARLDFIGNDMTGKTVGIVGLGNIGVRVSEMVRLLFGARVLAYDPYLDAAACRERGAEKVDLDTLCAEADFVSLHCPRTAETMGLMGEAQFARMKPGAYFVTTARGGIHDEAALYRALVEKRIAGAGLDVFAVEPPPIDDPLLTLDNVIVSPHTAGVSVESRHNIARIAAEQVLAVLDGERPPRLLNPEVWPRYRERYTAVFGRPPKD